MSAEKEIVNYWYNKNGFFTINNIKTSSNRDSGIIAMKPCKEGSEILHIGIMCSITANILEGKSLEKSASKIADEKFQGRSVIKAISAHLDISKKYAGKEIDIKKILVIGPIPKSIKPQIGAEFAKVGIEIKEFDQIIYEIFEDIDTQYYKNDILRTMQLTKYFLLSEPQNLARLISNANFTQNSRKEFLSSILDREQIVKEFKKTNAERLFSILKNSKIKPKDLAKLIGHSILNNKTRKPFMESLMEQEKTRKIIKRQKSARKLNMPLGRFFDNS